MENIKVLYEDNHLIAVFKPAGVLSQPDKTGDQSIFEQVKHYLKEKYRKPGQVFLGLVQRLDRPVSGIILFAKTSKGASRLSEQFRKHEIEKFYHAIVAGTPKPKQGTLVHRLGKDEKIKKAAAYADGAQAVLHYEVIATKGKYSLIEIAIETGKFHQIRAQLSLAGFPIVGDVKYGGERWQDQKAIALCATHLSFTTATGNQRITLSVEIPKDWNRYAGNQ